MNPTTCLSQPTGWERPRPRPRLAAQRFGRVLGLGFFLWMTWWAAHAAGTGFIPRNRAQIFMLGDSLTEGEDPDGYVNTTRLILAEVYPERRFFIANAGKGGDTAVNMDDRLERDVLRFKPDWVTVSAGVNDINHGFADHPDGDGPKGVSLGRFEEKIRGIAGRARERGVRVVLFSGTVIKEDLASPENQRMTRYSDALRAISRETGCVLADNRAAFCDVLRAAWKPGMAQSGLLTVDGVHLRAEGSWLMARTLLVAWGVPPERIDGVKPAVEARIRAQWAGLRENLAHYEEANREAGFPKSGVRRIVRVGWTPEDDWITAGAELPDAGIQMLDRSLRGETTRQLRSRFHQDVVALRPAAAVILAGGFEDFDPRHRMSIIDTESHLARIARLAKGSGIRLAIGAVTPLDSGLEGRERGAPPRSLSEVRRLNDWIRRLCAENDYVFVDLFPAVADGRGRVRAGLTDDGRHYNAAGLATLRPVVKRALVELAR